MYHHSSKVVSSILCIKYVSTVFVYILGALPSISGHVYFQNHECGGDCDEKPLFLVTTPPCHCLFTGVRFHICMLDDPAFFWCARLGKHGYVTKSSAVGDNKISLQATMPGWH